MPDSCHHPADRERGGRGGSGFQKKKREMAGAGAVSLDCLGGAAAFHRGAPPLSTTVDWGPGSEGAGDTHTGLSCLPSTAHLLAHPIPDPPGDWRGPC